jgi:2-(1,2-epoxy-1,2-dihydrophenyl)acetyl-CoA isomerase
MRYPNVSTGSINPAIRYEREGDLAIAVLANQEKLNPMSEAFLEGLLAVLETVRQDLSVRALLIMGEGKAFCVGADLAGFAPVAGDARSEGNRIGDMMDALCNRVVRELQSLPVPVLCAVNGAAAGAGVGLALAADLTIAARSAYFYLPFVPRLGIVPDMGTSWFIAQRIGQARALGLTLLGDRLPAEQAVQWGLIWASVDDAQLRTEAIALARRLARLPTHGATETRNAYAAAARNALPEQLNYETQRQRELIGRPEFAEGVAAFGERREPVFPRG